MFARLIAVTLIVSCVPFGIAQEDDAEGRKRSQDLILKRYGKEAQNVKGELMRLKIRTEDLEDIRNELYVDLFAKNRLRLPALEKTIPFDDDGIRNDAAVEIMRDARIESAAYTRALMQASPLVRGVGNRAGYLRGMEQVHDVSIHYLQAAWEDRMFVGRCIWKEMSDEEKAECQKHHPRFAREVNGENAVELTRLSAEINRNPQDTELYLARAKLHEQRMDYPQVLVDLGTVVNANVKNSPYARYLRGRHYEIFGLAPYVYEDYAAITPEHARKDPRINSANVKAFLLR